MWYCHLYNCWESIESHITHKQYLTQWHVALLSDVLSIIIWPGWTPDPVGKPLDYVITVFFFFFFCSFFSLESNSFYLELLIIDNHTRFYFSYKFNCFQVPSNHLMSWCLSSMLTTSRQLKVHAQHPGQICLVLSTEGNGEFCTKPSEIYPSIKVNYI